MQYLLDPIDAVNRRVGEWGSLVYLIIFAVTIYDVVLRYFFNAPTIWGLELVTALAGIHYLLAGGHALQKNAHVRIDVIYSLLPPRVQRAMRVIASVLTIVLMAVIVFYGARQAAPSIASGETTGAGWDSQAPMWMKISIPIGAALLGLQAAAHLIREVKGAGHVG